MSAEFLASKKTISGEQEKGGEIYLPESYVMEKAMAAEKVHYFPLISRMPLSNISSLQTAFFASRFLALPSPGFSQQV